MEKFTLNGEWRITSKTYDMIQPKKIAEQKRLLGYFYISQKFLSVDVWFGLCENSHNAKAKKVTYISILIERCECGSASTKGYVAHFGVQY